MPTSVQVIDTREIQVSIPTEPSDTHALGEFVSKAAADGLTLAGASEVTSGHQRDPYVVGLKLTFKRESS
jgi:hypothetical protein